MLIYERTHSPLRKTIKKANVWTKCIDLLVFTAEYHITRLYNPNNVF